MKHLAELIRKGLLTPGIVVDSEIFGAGIFEEKLHANSVGLALIGKIGVDESVRLFEQAVGEMNMTDGPASLRINQELGVPDFSIFESMVARHWDVEIDQVILELENETLPMG